MGASSVTVGFHDVFGAGGLVSERVVCADAADTVCVSVLLVLAVSCRWDRPSLSLWSENYQRIVRTKS